MISTLALGLLVAFALVAIVLNHAYARIGLVEVTLNEGLPPGHQQAGKAHDVVEAAKAASMLGPGLHIFLSRNCHACQRLVAELSDAELETSAAVHLRFIDRPPPAARIAADAQQASLKPNDTKTAASVGADPLPYTVAVGQHDLVAAAVSPTAQSIADVARDAGISAAIFYRVGSEQ